VLAQIYGVLLDLARLAVAFLPDASWLAAVYFALGALGLSLGISLLMKCGLPILPFDTFVRDMSEHFGWPVKHIKTALDMSFLALTLILSLGVLGRLEGVGIGTVIGALFTGSLVAGWSRMADRYFTFEPVLPILRRRRQKEREKNADASSNISSDV
jgi:uncharacterized membrane protein YczE